ncbi:MAG: vWA domain-containing protein, partial [Tissierella sp.]|uniref:vWA domain-containing protein n=1 Tax=Tissierella sp. TaxID=41274 RepID=UPI003F979D9F
EVKEVKEEPKKVLNPSFEFNIKTDKKAYKPWEDIIYTISIKNNGDVDLNNLLVKDSLTGLNQKIKLLKVGEKEEIKTIYNKFSTLKEKVKKNNIFISTNFDKKVISKNQDIEVKLLKPEIVKKKNSGSAFTEVDEHEEFPKEYQKYLDDLFKASISTLGMIGQSRTYVNPVPEYEDTIVVDKTAEITQGCRQYTVTLEIDGQIPEKPVDVILVIDRSGSMDAGNPTSMYYAKNAAKTFANTVLQNTNNRVALVSYAYSGSIYGYGAATDASLDRNFTNSYSDIQTSINNLNPTGGTNTQAGFRRSRILMGSNGRTNANKAIVLLTDGVPTVSIGNWYGPNYPTSLNNHANAAIAEGIASQDVARVFTVGLLNQVPSQTLPVARQVLEDSQNAGYYETFSAADLTAIYNQISQQLNYAAKAAVVQDKISDDFEFVEGSLSSSNATYDENTHEITWNAGIITEKTTLTYDIRAKESFEGGTNVATNDWAKLNYIDVNDDPKEKEFPVPTVDVMAPLKVDLGEDREMITDSIDIGENLVISSGTEPFTYEWSSSTDPGWSSDQRNPIVSPTEDTVYTLIVTDKNGCKAKDDIKIIVVRGSITISKVVTNENTYKRFTINISGPNGKTWSVMVKEGESQTIENLIGGTYNLEEIVPANYKAVGSRTRTVTITSENRHVNVSFENERTNDDWFYDDHDKDNLFKVILGN